MTASDLARISSSGDCIDVVGLTDSDRARIGLMPSRNMRGRDDVWTSMWAC